MDFNIQVLDQVTNPLEVVNLLGAPVAKPAGSKHYVTECPRCRNKLYILDREFVCENTNCSFRTGAVCDYLVATQKCKWDDVLDVMNNILDGRLNNTAVIKNKAGLGELLRTKRKFLDLFLRVGLSGSNNNISCMQYRNSLRAQGVNPDALKLSIFTLGIADTQILKDLLQQLHPGKSYNINDTCIVLPYFANYHTISHLLVLNTPASRPIKIPVYPHRVSYFGLLQRHPKNEASSLAYTYADAAKLSTQFSKISPEKVCLHMMLDATAGGMSFVLEHGEYAITADCNDDFRAIAVLQKYVTNLTVSDAKLALFKDTNTTPAVSFIIDSILNKVKTDVDIISLLDLVSFAPAHKQLLLKRLHEERLFDVATKANQYFKIIPIFTDDKVTLYNNAFGYTIRKNSKDVSATPVSNFLIELEQNVVFAESTDVLHAGNIIFNNVNYPIIIKQDELNRVNDIEKAARNSTLGAHHLDGDNMPTIKDRGAGKYIVSYLRDRISSLPRTEGIPSLGWSGKRTSYYSPYFIADIKGTRVGNKYFHPNNAALVNFSSGVDTLMQLHGDLPEEIIYIINQAATFIIRSFLSMPVKPIAIYNNMESRMLLSALFSGVGQVGPHQLNHNIRGEDSPGIRGFPFYAAGYTYGQVNKSILSAFILCDAGVSITATYMPDIIDKAKCTLRYVIQKVAEWAISTKADKFVQTHSVSRTNAYSQEGANVIMHACDLGEWPTSKTPFQLIDDMLSHIKFEDVKQYFVKDINRHTIKIKDAALRSVPDRSGLERELGTLSRNIHVDGSSIDVDAESMADALTTFYHAAPIVTELFDPDALFAKNDKEIRTKFN